MIVKIVDAHSERVIECDEYSIVDIDVDGPHGLIRWRILRKGKSVLEKTLKPKTSNVKFYVTEAGKTIDTYSYPLR